MSVHQHRLWGCQPQPLAAYLKALGVLRLIGAQVDGHATGHWEADGFVLATELDDEELAKFFLDRYEPTPVLSPWNSSSGFGPEGRGGLVVIEGSSDARVAAYRDAIATARRLLSQSDEQGWSKEQCIIACRSQLPDSCLPWLDAAVVVTAGGPAWPPLLGTGGNLGRFDVSRNFHQQVVAVLGLASRDDGRRTAWLNDALYGLGRSAGVRGSASQFDPGAVGGANSAPTGEAEWVLNPWDLVLMVEGTMLFASGAARRLAVGAPARAAAPFTVSNVAVGFATASTAEPTKGELWAPLWGRPATAVETQRLFAEGRADWRDRHARTGLDFAKAASSLGVDRGLSAFARYAFLERHGQSTIAVSVGRVAVREESSVRLLADVDRWLETVRRGANPPEAVRNGLRAVDGAAFDLTRSAPDALVRLLVQVARLEGAIGRATSFRDKTQVSPVRGLGARDWVPELLKGASTELRLALALASGRDLDGSRRVVTSNLRTLLRPICYQADGSPTWSDKTAVEGLGVTSAVDLLARAHVRRVVDVLATRHSSPTDDGQPGLRTAYAAGLTASLADVAALASHLVDESLLSDMLAAALLLDFQALDRWPTVDEDDPDTPVAPPPALTILGPFYARQRSPDVGQSEWSASLARATLRPEATWPALLAAGRIRPALEAAVRRLRIAGLDPLADAAHVAAGLDHAGPALAAATFCPLSASSRTALLHKICPPPIRKEAVDAQT